MLKISLTLLCSISILLNSADLRKSHNPYNAQVVSYSLFENSLNRNPFNYQGIRETHKRKILETFRKKRNNINEPLTLEAIQEATEKLQTAIQSVDLKGLHNFHTSSPTKFQAALNTKSGIIAFQNLLTKTRPGANDLEEQEEEIICLCIQHISLQNFTYLNDEDGQSLVHKFTPLHWHSGIIKTLEEKTRLDVRTTQKDDFPGTTMAHSVASILRKKQKVLDSIMNDCEFAETRKLHITRGIDFLVGWCTKYPKTIAWLSKNSKHSKHSKHSKNKFRLSFWNLLSPKHRTLIYQKLAPETIQTINAELTKAWEKDLLLLKQYLTLKAEFSEPQLSTKDPQ